MSRRASCSTGSCARSPRGSSGSAARASGDRDRSDSFDASSGCPVHSDALAFDGDHAITVDVDQPIPGNDWSGSAWTFAVAPAWTLEVAVGFEKDSGPASGAAP